MGAPPITTTPDATPAGQQEQAQRAVGLAFEAEHGLIGSRQIVFATRNLPPPSELYITSDDGLYITATGLQAGVSLNIAAQILLPDGRLSSNLYTIQPPATSTPTSYFYSLTEGYLFNVTVQPVPTLRRGSVWVSVAIRRGNITSGVTLQTLIQDYVDAFSGPTWPGGLIRSSTDGTGLLTSVYTAALTAGQNYTYTVPANTRIAVRSVSAYFTAGAGVANRNGYLQMLDPAGNVVYMDWTEPTIVASGNCFYVWAALLGWAQTAISGGNLLRGLPALQLSAGSQVQVAANNIQAADKWQLVNLTLEQWFST